MGDRGNHGSCFPPRHFLPAWLNEIALIRRTSCLSDMLYAEVPECISLPDDFIQEINPVHGGSASFFSL